MMNRPADQEHERPLVTLLVGLLTAAVAALLILVLPMFGRIPLPPLI